MKQAGLSPQIAAFVLSLMSIIQLPHNLVAGYVADKVKIRYVIAGNF